MPFMSACPNCDESYNLADELVDKKVRCKKCQSAFVAVPVAARRPPESLTSAPEQRNRGSRVAFDEDSDDERPRARRGAKKRSQSQLPVAIIVASCLAGVFVLGIVALAMFFFSASTRSAQSTSNLPATVGAEPGRASMQQRESQPTSQPKPKPAPEFPVTLSNAQFHTAIPHNKLSVDYEFHQGGPSPGEAYTLHIISDSGDHYTMDLGWQELSNMGTISGRTISFGPRGLGQGACRLYLESGFGLAGGKRRVSNIIRTDGKSAGEPATGQPATNSGQQPGATSAPAGVARQAPERKKLAAEEIDKLLPDLASGNSHSMIMACDRLASALPEEVTPAKQGTVATALARALKHDDSSVRWAAARGLQKWSEKSCLPALIVGIKDPHFPVRHICLELVGKSKDPSAAKAVADCLMTDRQQAQQALEAMGPAAEAAVIPFLKYSDMWVRGAACGILEKIGAKASIAPLQEAAKDSEFFVKSAAERALRAVKFRSQ